MFESKINELKTTIRNLYNLYLESDDKREYITKLARIFNIPIFEVLANNYKIVSIDIENLSIVIEDIKYNITYNSSYKSSSDLFNYYGNVIRFIEVIETNNDKYVKNVYHIGDEEPVISKMVFENDGQVLEFIKEESLDENTFLDNGKKVIVRYLVNEDGSYVPLLTKVYKRNNDDLFERTYTYDGVNYNCEGNLIDKSIYVDNGNIIYIVDDLVTQNNLAYIKGICFENTHIDMNKYKINGFNLNDFEELNDKQVISAIIFKGIIDDELCLLEIYKKNDCINIKYRKHNNVIDEVEDICVLYENMELSILSSGKISDLEINAIIKSLKSDEFINIIINELNTFVKKKYIKDGIMEEEYSSLTPSMLINKSSEVIVNMIEKSKIGYIDLIANEFCLLTGLQEKKK